MSSVVYSAGTTIGSTWLNDVNKQVWGVNHYGADNTGVSSSVSAFQQAIDATTNSGIQSAVVPPGTYLGDMTTLNYGNRTFVWDERQGGVTYSTAAPKSPNVSTTVVRVRSKYAGDATRPWTVGYSAFANDVTDGTTSDRPTVRIVRDANHTGGSTSANTSALSVATNINQTSGRVDNYENCIVLTLNSYRNDTATGSPNIALVQGTAFKKNPSTGNIFGANFVARDETKRASSVSKGGIISIEADVVVSGPDDLNTRVVVDAIARGYDASADGATTCAYGMRVRPANSGVLSAEPVQIVYGYGTDVGVLGSIGTHFYAEGAAGTAHMEAWGDNTGVGLIRIGCKRQTVAQDIARIDFTGWNDASVKTAYAQIIANQTGVTSGNESGALVFKTQRAGVNTTEAAFNGGLIVGVPTGTYKGVGSINIADKLYVNGTQVVTARDTGWTAMTGSSNKATAYDTATVTLAQLAGRVMALQAVLTTHGLIGA